MSLNRVTIAGRLSKDLELRRTQSGTAVTSFTIAVDGDFKDKQTGERPTYWIDCVAWGITAEFMARYLSSKGRMVMLDGRLQTRTWTDKDGNRRKIVEVVADHVYFGDSKREDSGGGQVGYGTQTSYGGYSAPADGYPAQPDPDSEFAELTTDDGTLPF